MKYKPKVTISVVSHNNFSNVKNLIDSANQFLFSNSFTICFVITWNIGGYGQIPNCKFEVQHIINMRRRGFGVNHNKAFEAFPSDIFIILNPDVMFIEPFDMDQFLFGACSREVLSPVLVDRERMALDFCRPMITPSALLRRWFKRSSTNSYIDFDWFSGAFICMQSKMFYELRGFDENFFMYVEDCDLCVRAREVGANLRVIHTHSLVHLANRGSRKSLWLFTQHVRSLVYFWIKRFLTRFL